MLHGNRCETTTAEAYIDDVSAEKNLSQLERSVLKTIIAFMQNANASSLYIDAQLRASIAELCLMSEKTVASTLSRIVNKQLLTKSARGVYTLNHELIPHPRVLDRLTEVVTTTCYVAAPLSRTGTDDYPNADDLPPLSSSVV